MARQFLEDSLVGRTVRWEKRVLVAERERVLVVRRRDYWWR